MNLFLFRHAERKNDFLDDPELSANGFLQAKALCEMVQSQQILKPFRLFASPKIRAQQTFRFLSHELKLSTEVSTLLDERGRAEPVLDFQKRIHSFLGQATTEPKNTFAVTHLDWLQEAMPILLPDFDNERGLSLHFSPGEYEHFQWSTDHWKRMTRGRIKI